MELCHANSRRLNEMSKELHNTLLAISILWGEWTFANSISGSGVKKRPQSCLCPFLTSWKRFFFSFQLLFSFSTTTNASRKFHLFMRHCWENPILQQLEKKFLFFREWSSVKISPWDEVVDDENVKSGMINTAKIKKTPSERWQTTTTWIFMQSCDWTSNASPSRLHYEHTNDSTKDKMRFKINAKAQISDKVIN